MLTKKPTDKEVLLDIKSTMDAFISKIFASQKDKKKVLKISLEKLRKLKDKNISLEFFLDYFCQKQNLLMHGSVQKISDNKIISNQNKIFASDKSSIAIMRSLYSNIGVNLEYPYYINEQNPLVLRVHTPTKKKCDPRDTGYIYLLERRGFENEPKDSWQYIKETDAAEFFFIVETEKSDFRYHVEIINDYAK